MIAEPLDTERLRLEPQRVADADEMAILLDDASLHEFIGGRPETARELHARYARQAGVEDWLNWVVRLRATGEAVGYVQATLSGVSATLAWVTASAHQGNGYATEAAAAMADWLLACGVELLVANVHPGHDASIAVARHLGLVAGTAGANGEIRFTDPRKASA